MKQLFSIFFACITITASATVRTVSNNPITIAQFSTVQAAINASNSGDTIYVHGSPNNYAIESAWGGAAAANCKRKFVFQFILPSLGDVFNNNQGTKKDL